MAKNWAIAIGINEYDYLQPLKYAKRDAQLMQEFLRNEAGFERVFFFSDDSPDLNGKSTRPNRANLRRVLLDLFKNPFMEAGDNFWFFFSGHGMRHADRDYLMPSDGNSADIEDTAIPINFVTERLRPCGADNVVLIIDACRQVGTRGEGIGRQTASMARQTGVITIFSCSPNEYSYEIEALQQGAFTHALLEGLGISRKCATVERLNQYLSWRVPEVVRQHKNARQTPYTIAEPVTKSHLILVPQYATLADIATLKNDAYQALVAKDIDLAEQLWIRVLTADSRQDMEAVKALQGIERLRVGNSLAPSSGSSSNLQEQSKKAFVELPSSIEQNIPSISKFIALILIAIGGAVVLGTLLGITFPPGKYPSPHPSISPSPHLPLPRPTPTKSISLSQPNSTKQLNAKSKSGSGLLKSDRGVDYTRLQSLLAAQKWKEADLETRIVMLKAAGREQSYSPTFRGELKGYFDNLSLETFPCTDLRTIDQLWRKYSKGHFGFSVQKPIWVSIGGSGKPQDYGNGSQLNAKFAERVGWRVIGKRLNYDQLTFYLDAPKGHFPADVYFEHYFKKKTWWGEELEQEIVTEYGQGVPLMSRVIKCELK